ncbi:3-isopropylmalate dehydratase small subunit [Herminiimonas contaminans]|uniref:3-isopropylmalate dehydratase small subunit n=1 Tax=Herminiimonas contaminans TaxID=1111140 RepID=A0ABS0EUJ2_9BURK|nr:3-isopropylmalate dehydratase small subunit [Herminiimonas contaminans]MBF8178218.1 3-isopropylmalate dehydratase small subunit [Herminiimonas contaminans]
MKKTLTIRGQVVPIDRPNIDTDAIIPKQFMKSIVRSGLGKYLFDQWRFLDIGELGNTAVRTKNPDFVLNLKRYENASILLARENFGCGSSREHAVWALEDYGITAVIAPSFGDIFFSNCYKNRIVAIQLQEEEINILFQQINESENYSLLIDLENQLVHSPFFREFRFALDPIAKHRILNGFDEVTMTLQHNAEIAAFEGQRAIQFPWMF